jgi:hypothetical protein
MGIITAAIAMVAPGLAIPLRLLSWAKGATAALWGLVSRYPVQCACVALVLANGWQWHSAGITARRDARAQVVWAQAFAIEQAAFGTLAGAIARQNTAIDQWRIAGEARHQIATRALRDAAQAGQRLTREADQIDRTAPPAIVGADCRTPSDVMHTEADL